MTATTALAATLRTLALASGGYATPDLNDCLYAGGAGLGWVAAGNGGGSEDEDGRDGGGTPAASFPPPLFPALARYTGLRALHLDRNGLAGDLTGWPALPALAALHLADNALTSLTGLTSDTAPALALLDVSGNRLTSLVSVGGVAPSLTCLRAARNPLSGGEGAEQQQQHDTDPLAALATATRLVTLDVSDCALNDGRSLLAALSCLPALRCLGAGGNPGADVGAAFLEGGWKEGGGGGGGGDASSTTTFSPPPSRRLALAAAAPALTYLDDSPVFGGERAAADAWAAGGGVEGAVQAREAWAAGERARRGELQGGGGLVNSKLEAMRAGRGCWVVEVPQGEEEEEAAAAAV